MLISFWGSLLSVERMPPQIARSPSGAVTSAAFWTPAQPALIGTVAPIVPSGAMLVCSRSSVTGPVG